MFSSSVQFSSVSFRSVQDGIDRSTCVEKPIWALPQQLKKIANSNRLSPTLTCKTLGRHVHQFSSVQFKIVLLDLHAWKNPYALHPFICKKRVKSDQSPPMLACKTLGRHICQSSPVQFSLVHFKTVCYTHGKVHNLYALTPSAGED